MMKITQKIVGFLGAIALAVSASLLASSVANAADIGTTWSNATLPAGSAGLDSIAYGDGVFIGVNADGDILRSADGKTWASISSRSVEWTAVAFGENTFSVLGFDASTSDTVFTYSTDNGLTFANTSVAADLGGESYSALTYGAGIFVATTLDDLSGYSADGSLWTDGGSLDDGDPQVGLAYGNGMFVSVSESSSINFVADPVNDGWDTATPSEYINNSHVPDGGPFSQVVFDGNKFLVIYADTTHNSNYVYTSTDGEFWSGVPAVGLGSGARVISGLAWDGSSWIAGAGGTGTGIYRSVDGVTWTQVDANNTQWPAFALGNNIVVAGGQPQGSTAQGLNTTLAVGWSVPTVEPTVAPTPVTPTELPNTGMNPTSLTVSAAVAAFMIALGLVVLRRARNAK